MGKQMPRGIIRRIDDLGRITLPKEMRRSLKLEVGDEVDIFFNDGAICVKPNVETVKPPLSDFTDDEIMAELFRRRESR